MADTSSTAPSSKTELSTTQAAISWLGADGQTRYLYQKDSDPSRQITLDIYFDATSQAALFRVRATVDLKAFPNEKTPLYLYLYADRITSLVRDGCHRIPKDVRRRLGAGSICLHFGLTKPADMVVPLAPLVPVKQKGHGDRLDAMKLLARATSLTVYLAGGSLPSETLLQNLCTAVAEGGLKAFSGAAAPSGLYGGKGGKVFEDSDLVPPPTSSPPSYDELNSPPPFKLATELGAGGPRRSKRRRGSRDEEDVEVTCRRVLKAMMAQHRQEEREFLRGELRQMKTDILTHVEERIDKLGDELGLANVCSKDELSEEIDQVQDYNDRMIDVKLDDRIDYVKLELEEYVEAQLEGAEERVLDRLRTASLVLDIAD